MLILVKMFQLIFVAAWLIYIHPVGVGVTILYLWAMLTISGWIDFGVSALYTKYTWPKPKKRSGQHVPKINLQQRMADYNKHREN